MKSKLFRLAAVLISTSFLLGPQFNCLPNIGGTFALGNLLGGLTGGGGGG
jgi:hypothetical protein